MKWRKLLMVISLSVFLYSAFQITTYFYDSYKTKAAYDKIRKEYEDQLNKETDKPSQPTSSPGTEPGSTPGNKSEEPVILNRYLPLLEINEDVVGWVSVAGTVIDYPVVQAEDNDFYLRRNIHGEKANAGTIFMDYRSDALAKEKHVILYGHHMRNGTMFKDLVKYNDETFFLEHGTVNFDTLYEEAEWEVFSVYVTNPNFNYRQTHFSTEEEYLKFIDMIADKSIYQKEMVFTPEDQILTLSTCTYVYDDARFVVHARRIR